MNSPRGSAAKGAATELSQTQKMEVFKDFKLPQTEADNVMHYRRMEAAKTLTGEKYINLS